MACSMSEPLLLRAGRAPRRAAGEFQGKKGVLVYLTRQTAQTKEMQLKDLKVQESGRNEVIAQFR